MDSSAAVGAKCDSSPSCDACKPRFCPNTNQKHLLHVCIFCVIVDNPVSFKVSSEEMQGSDISVPPDVQRVTKGCLCVQKLAAFWNRALKPSLPWVHLEEQLGLSAGSEVPELHASALGRCERPVCCLCLCCASAKGKLQNPWQLQGRALSTVSGLGDTQASLAACPCLQHFWFLQNGTHSLTASWEISQDQANLLKDGCIKKV